MTIVNIREIPGIVCSRCGANMLFEPTEILEFTGTTITLSLSCDVCRNEELLQVSAEQRELRYAKKANRADGARADYQDAYSALRLMRRTSPFYVGVFMLNYATGVGYDICGKVVASLSGAMLNTDREPGYYLYLRAVDNDDLPF